MGSMFGVKIEVNLIEPDFSNASVPLSQIANKVATNARRNIRNQTNINGSSFTRLSVKTIKDKVREGAVSPRKALFRKGIMFRAIHVYKTGKNNFNVGIIPRGKPQRDMIAEIHQNIGPVIRTFLGFNQQTYQWAWARINRWIVERKQKAKKKSYSINY